MDEVPLEDLRELRQSVGAVQDVEQQCVGGVAGVKVEADHLEEHRRDAEQHHDRDDPPRQSPGFVEARWGQVIGISSDHSRTFAG